MSEFLSKESVQKYSQCREHLIGIAAYPKHGENKPYLTIYSETLKGGKCQNHCEYVDIFGVMLVKLATKITDTTMCNLYITAVDGNTGNYIDPVKDNKAAIKLLLHVGPTLIRIKTDDGEIKYNRRALEELLND